jgi:Tol biopolymer transport system component
LPTWSRDGRTLFFVQRRLLQTLHAKDGLGNQRDLRIFSSSIYRSDVSGAGLTRLLTEDAFGFGALNPTPDGVIIFSRVDNDWAVWQHRKGNVLAPDQGEYAPRVQIQRLNIGGALTRLAPNAGQPMVG